MTFRFWLSRKVRGKNKIMKLTCFFCSRICFCLQPVNQKKKNVLFRVVVIEIQIQKGNHFPLFGYKGEGDRKMFGQNFLQCANNFIGGTLSRMFSLFDLHVTAIFWVWELLWLQEQECSDLRKEKDKMLEQLNERIEVKDTEPRHTNNEEL